MERGRDANIEKHENRFADMERREGSGWDAEAREMVAHARFAEQGG